VQDVRWRLRALATSNFEHVGRAMTTRITSVFICLFWLAMMTSLVVQDILPGRRQARSSLVDPEILALQWVDLHDWSWIQRNNEKVGAMVSQVVSARQPGDADNENRGYIAIQNAEATFSMFGLRRHVRFKMTLHLSPSFHVVDFVALITSRQLIIECAGFVRGNKLYYRIAPQGVEPIYRFMDLKQPISLAEAVRPMIARHFDLEVGKEFRTDVVDPVFGMKRGQAILRVAAQEVIEQEGQQLDVYRVEQTFDKITKNSWVTPNGVTVRRELIQGYMLEKSNKPAVLDIFPDIAHVLRIPDFHHLDFMQRAHAVAAQQGQPGAAPEFDIFSLLGRPAAKPTP